MIKRIDTHQHFWRYNANEYPWIGQGMDSLRRDFLPADLQLAMSRAGISQSVPVQARQSVAETEWLIRLADENPFIAGVVGWIPLTNANVAGDLERLVTNRKLKGIRHVLQDEPDSHYMLRADFNAGISLLPQFGLVYDILIFERHLPQTIEFVDRHPDQVFVLDHLAKPRVRDNLLSPWRENISEIAKRPNIFCKLSGLVTEAGWLAWSPRDFDPYFDTILESFTPKRILFGSDWPVLLLAAAYEQWVQVVERAISPLSTEEQEQIWSGTAAVVYGL